MFHHTLSEEIEGWVFLKWYMLAFLAGNVNAGGFLAAGTFVTHVTGFATEVGVSFAHFEWERVLGYACVPIFFLIGTMFSAFVIDIRFHRQDKPHYDVVMFLVFLCLVTAAFGGHYHLFGAFDGAVRFRREFVLLSLLCLASGLQNAAITTATGASVRTTHLTGVTTDLGIGIIRALHTEGRERRIEVQATLVRMGTILFYIIGSIVGAMMFVRFKYLGFLLPATIALYAMVQAIREREYL